MFLLDTNIILYITRKKEILDFIIEKYSIDDYFTSFISVGEIQLIAKRNNWGKKKSNELYSILHRMTVIWDINEEITNNYVDIKYKLEKNGLMIDINDIWIASIALSVPATVISTDKKHFSRISGLNPILIPNDELKKFFTMM